MKNSLLSARTGLRLVLFSFITFLSNQLPAQEQIGRPLITNYKYQEYGADPVNWWATEDANGIMYFANNRGVWPKMNRVSFT